MKKATRSGTLRSSYAHLRRYPESGVFEECDSFASPMATATRNTQHEARQQEDPMSTFVMHMGAFGQRLQHAFTQNGGPFVELCF